MTLSMTGYAALEQPIENATLTLELRAVNSRYLDLHFKLEDALKNLEPILRERIAAKINRGKVECKLALLPQNKAVAALQINQEILQQITNVSAHIHNHFPNSAALSVGEILRWPGVLAGTETSPEKLLEAVEALIEKTLQDFNASRAREGEKLQALILDRVQQIEQLVEKVKPWMSTIVQEHRSKLEAKLSEIVKTLDHERISQELVLFMQRVDVDEELARLSTHVTEVKRILSQAAPAGKRLDFLMQELNREANTLGSKSVSVQTTQASMELKVLIEQMREQIQNIE
jgi:uncharacterized protein (TIGR00255 family)